MSNFRHGMVESRTYQAWTSMKRRCLAPRSPNYQNYGGRGIKVCEQWMNFKGFYADMGDCPDGYSLERIDVNGNYEPSNCKWIPAREQHLNMRRSITVEIDGMRMGLKEACLKLGLNYRTVQSRINLLGRSKEEALGLCTNSAQSAGLDLKEAA